MTAPRIRRSLTATTLVLALLVSGCGEGGSDEPTGGSTAPRESGPDETRPATTGTTAPTTTEAASTTTETVPPPTTTTVPIDEAALPLTEVSFPEVGMADPDSEIAELLAFEIGGGPSCPDTDALPADPVLLDDATQDVVTEVEVGALFQVCWAVAPDGSELTDPDGRPVAPDPSTSLVVLPGAPLGTYSVAPLGGGPSFPVDVVAATRPHIVVAPPDDGDLAPDGRFTVDVLLTGYAPDTGVPVAVYEGGGVGYILDGVPSDPPGPLLGVVTVATNADGAAHLAITASDPAGSGCATVLPDPQRWTGPASAVEVAEEGELYLLRTLAGVAETFCFEGLRGWVDGGP